MKLPRILITAMRSGAGKTMLTCGILKAMKMQDLSPASSLISKFIISARLYQREFDINYYKMD